jgi:uncharacterized protein
MTEHVVKTARATPGPGIGPADVAITICYTGASKRDFCAWLGTDLRFEKQISGDLGARMLGAFETALRKGASAVIGIGTDLPGMTPGILRNAIEALRHKDVVIGRADDGGYYLIGMTSRHPRLFQGIDWGTGGVYEQTCERIRRLGLALAETPRLKDVDRPEDLEAILDDPGFSDVFSGRPSLSIIIPTLNESDTIARMLKCLGRSEDVEPIVADGGSLDETCDIAAREGAKVLKVQGGRAMQQNAGAAAAKGGILLFLHADTMLPAAYAERIRRALDCPSTVAGAFRFETDDQRRVMRLVERVTNLRSTVFQMPYGDQGLFLEKRVFDEMGGFHPLPIMEDFELVQRLRRRGRIVTLPQAALTSARRWQRLGMVRTTLINQIMIAGFLMGMPIQRLHRLYAQTRKPV